MKTSLNHSWEKLQSSSYLSPSSPSRSCPHCARVCTSRNPARPTLAFYNLSWTMTEKSTHKKPDFCRHSGNWVWKSWPGVLSQQLHKAVCFCVFGKLITLITLTNYQWAALCPTLLLFGVNCPHHQLLPEYPGWGLHHHCWAQGPEQGGLGCWEGSRDTPGMEVTQSPEEAPGDAGTALGAAGLRTIWNITQPPSACTALQTCLTWHPRGVLLFFA